MTAGACASHDSKDTDAARSVTAEEIEWLFVQSCSGVVLEDDVLRLSQVDPVTVFLSDRPARQAGLGSTEEFIAYWTDGGWSDNSARSAPNATLSVVTAETAEDVVVELMNPRFDGADLLYDANVIATRPSSGAPPPCSST